MYTFFNSMSSVNQGILYLPEWNHVKDGLRRNLGKVVSTYRNMTMTVKSDHFLARILQSIPVSKALPLDRYYEHVDAMAMNLATSLKMTSPRSAGMIFDGVFYGRGNDEVLIATDEYFDYREVDRDWQNAAPVKVLMHPRSDYGLNLPNGINSGVEEGLVVVLINIPKLAIQYRAFRRNEEAVNSDGESQRTVMHFIHMYVLPNMLFSHLDIVVFNRIYNLLVGAPMGESRRAHPFFMPDYSTKSDNVQLQILKNITSRNYTFTSILQSIPGVVKKDMQQALLMPEIAPTRQVLWALTAARLKPLDLLFRCNKLGPGNPNQVEVNRVLREAMAQAGDNLMRSSLPPDLYYDVEYLIRSIKNHA